MLTQLSMYFQDINQLFEIDRPCDHDANDSCEDNDDNCDCCIKDGEELTGARGAPGINDSIWNFHVWNAVWIEAR